MVKLSAPTSFAITKAILQNPVTSQLDIARKTNVSTSMVSYLVRDLVAKGIISQFGKEKLRLEEPLTLLEALAFQRPLYKLIEEEFRTEESNIGLVEKQIEITSKNLEARYALTCFSALTKYIQYYITYPTVHLYSDKPKDLKQNIIEGRGAVNVQVLKPDSRTIFQDASTKNNVWIVDPIQTVIDLFSLGGVGRDGAMKLYKETTNVNSISH